MVSGVPFQGFPASTGNITVDVLIGDSEAEIQNIPTLAVAEPPTWMLLFLWLWRSREDSALISRVFRPGSRMASVPIDRIAIARRAARTERARAWCVGPPPA